jgi:hypothetical protein
MNGSSDGTVLAARPGEQVVVVWTSPDGTTWKAATPAGPGLAAPGIQAITGLAVSGRTLTGVGFTAPPQRAAHPLAASDLVTHRP